MAASLATPFALQAAAAAASVRRTASRRNVATRAAAFEMPSEYKKVRTSPHAQGHARDPGSASRCHPSFVATRFCTDPMNAWGIERFNFEDRGGLGIVSRIFFPPPLTRASFAIPSPRPPRFPPSQIAPLGTNVLVKIAEAETQTAGGIILAESAQRKPTSGPSPHFFFSNRPKPCKIAH